MHKPSSALKLLEDDMGSGAVLVLAAVTVAESEPYLSVCGTDATMPSVIFVENACFIAGVSAVKSSDDISVEDPAGAVIV
jgi:hypothetical protein